MRGKQEVVFIEDILNGDKIILSLETEWMGVCSALTGKLVVAEATVY